MIKLLVNWTICRCSNIIQIAFVVKFIKHFLTNKTRNNSETVEKDQEQC